MVNNTKKSATAGKVTGVRAKPTNRPTSSGRSLSSLASKKNATTSSTSQSKSHSTSSHPSSMSNTVNTESTKNNTSGSAKVNLNPKSVELVLQRIAPATAAKVGFLLSIAFGIIILVAAAVFWFMLDKSGTLVQMTGTFASSGLNNVISTDAITLDKIIPILVIIICINSLLFTLLTTIMALIYNTIAKIVGGVKLFFTRS